MGTQYETVTVEDRGPVRIVTINRPEVLNALNEQVVAELSRVFEALSGPKPSSEIRGVVLTGAGGKAFVAGADIAAMQGMSADEAMTFASSGHAVGEMIGTLPVPVIAAVDGFALGGGCELALACDFIYAGQRAKFGQPEVKLGVIPGFGGTQRLTRRIGIARTLELCLTGATIGADEALRIGLVNKVVEAGTAVEAAVATVETIAKMGPIAIAKAKHVIHEGAETPLPAANRLEVEAFASLFDTSDQSEGMKAFLAKRAAEFTNE